jgi:hypothetical protein
MDTHHLILRGLHTRLESENIVFHQLPSAIFITKVEPNSNGTIVNIDSNAYPWGDLEGILNTWMNSSAYASLSWWTRAVEKDPYLG